MIQHCWLETDLVTLQSSGTPTFPSLTEWLLAITEESEGAIFFGVCESTVAQDIWVLAQELEDT